MVDSQFESLKGLYILLSASDSNLAHSCTIVLRLNVRRTDWNSNSKARTLMGKVLNDADQWKPDERQSE